MTRIDEALRRARNLQAGAPPAPDDITPTPPESPVNPAAAHRRRAEEQLSAGSRALDRLGADGFTSFTRIVPQAPVRGRVERQRLITAIDTSDPTQDQFRSLAATLHQAQLERSLNILTITSSASGEGKSLVSANLALTLSQSYNRSVLLIDADLRRPGLHKLFPVPPDAGLAGALSAIREGASVAVHELSPRLALLPAGRSTQDPVSIFSSDAMYRLVSAASNAFDWVILDAPPVGMLPDATLISSLTDAVLLVVEAGKVRYQLVQRTVETIGADRIFGVVLNKVREADLVSAYGADYYTPYR